jgi:hypothetical protein
MRHFTVEEANEALAEVRPLAERMVHHRQILARREDELQVVGKQVAGNGGGLDPQRVGAVTASAAEAAREIDRAITAIEALGAQVKDVDTGLVDFPARRGSDGETVLLCWRLGEAEIAFWHGLEEGFAGRKPLPL